MEEGSWVGSPQGSSDSNQEVLGRNLGLSCCYRSFPGCPTWTFLCFTALASGPSRGPRPLMGLPCWQHPGKGRGPGLQSLVRPALGQTGLTLFSPSGQRCRNLAGERPSSRTCSQGEAVPPCSSFPESLLGSADSPFSQGNMCLKRLLRRQDPREGDEVKGCPGGGESRKTMPRKVGGTPKTP